MYSVILVEDEDNIRKGIHYAVPWEQYCCTVIGEARNGVEGVELIQKMNPDIVISDINMPVMDGLQMIAQTKYQYNYVAILLTGYSDFEYAREAIKYGVSDYLLKPLDIEEMEETLDRAVLECKNIRILQERHKHTVEMRNLSLFCDRELRTPEDPLVAQILEYIAKNYVHKVTLTDISEQLYYSDRYINKKFQKAMGTTVIEYLNRYRIQKAIHLLHDETLPISEIGGMCGIGDYKYFTQVFKKYVGCSPKEYRQQIL